MPFGNHDSENACYALSTEFVLCGVFRAGLFPFRTCCEHTGEATSGVTGLKAYAEYSFLLSYRRHCTCSPSSILRVSIVKTFQYISDGSVVSTRPQSLKF